MIFSQLFFCGFVESDLSHSVWHQSCRSVSSILSSGTLKDGLINTRCHECHGSIHHIPYLRHRRAKSSTCYLGLCLVCIGTCIWDSKSVSQHCSNQDRNGQQPVECRNPSILLHFRPHIPRLWGRSVTVRNIFHEVRLINSQKGKPIR